MDAATLHVTLPVHTGRCVTMHRYMVLPELHFVISSNVREKHLCPQIGGPKSFTEEKFKIIHSIIKYLIPNS